MFTGLVAERGRVSADPAPSGGGGVRLRITHSEALGARLAVGDSLAVAGVCLTIATRSGAESALELSPETLSRTTLGSVVEGDQLNLEPALRAGDPLGGHWVQGHVDGVLRALARRDFGSGGNGGDDHRELRFELPAAFASMVAEKGSVTLDGVSLTVSAVGTDSFSVALIPHTLAVTTLGALVPGGRVNFEVDVLARYVARALAMRGAPAPDGVR